MIAWGGAAVVLGGTEHYTRTTANDWAGQSRWLFGRASPTNHVRCVGLDSEEKDGSKPRGGSVWHERKALAGVALCIALALDMHEHK